MKSKAFKYIHIYTNKVWKSAADVIKTKKRGKTIQ